MSALHITAIGLVTALGLDTDTTIASLRAGLDAFQRMPFAGLSGKDLQGAPIAGFAEGIAGIDRYEALALQALRPCLADLDAAEREHVFILLGLPRADRPGVPPNLADDLARRLATALGLTPSAIVPLSYGRVAAFGGLKQAREVLQARPAALCIVGGVDVLTNGESLRGLSRARLLKEEWDGFIPGEAAAFVRVQATQTSGPWHAQGTWVAGLGVARESAIGDASSPLTGEAVCAAVRAACAEARAADSDLHLLINDVNGSRAAFEDNAMGRIRFFRSPTHFHEVWHIASCLGETGAACGGLELAWAAAALDLGMAPGRGVLLTASDGDLRTAAIVQGGSAAPGGHPNQKRQISRGRAALQPPPAPVEPAQVTSRGLSLAGDDLSAQLIWRHHQELTWLWRMREHHHRQGQAWAGIDSYETRLWGHLDALSWAGLKGREAIMAGLQSKDPHEIASAMLVLLSYPLEAGMVAPVADLALRSELHLEVLTSVLPHVAPEVARPMLKRMASSPQASFSQAGLRGMMAMRWSEPDVVRAQISAADHGTAACAIQLAGALGLVDLNEIAAVRAARDEDVMRSGMTKVALLSLGLSVSTVPGLQAARLAREAPIAAALLCLRDGRNWLELLPEMTLTLATIDACGWAGEAGVAPHLLHLLESADPQHRAAAERALVRIYGAVVVPHLADVPNTPDAPSALPDRAAWEQGLAQAGLPVAGTQRLRHGQPWSVASAWAHLNRPECGYTERQIAAWEHAVVHRRGLPVHPGQFVAMQRLALSS